MHDYTVRSEVGTVSYERNTPVGVRNLQFDGLLEIGNRFCDAAPGWGIGVQGLGFWGG